MRTRRRSISGRFLLVALATATATAAHLACGLFVSPDDYDREYRADAGFDVAPLPDAPVDGAVADADAGCTADIENDPASCGACGRSCAGRACSKGRCATANGYPGVGAVGIGLADAGIFVATFTAPPLIARLGYDLALGPTAAGGDLAFSLAVDDAVYWTDFGGAVRSTSFDLTAETVIGRTDASAAMLTKRPLSPVYWTVRAASVNGGGVYFGGGPDTGTRLEPADEAFGITDDDTYVYYAQRVPGGVVKRRQKAGAESIVIATAKGVPVQLGADDFHVYFTDCAEGTVVRVTKDGTETKVIASGLDHPYAIAVDRDHVYVSTLSTNIANCAVDRPGTDEVATIERITKATGQRLVLADKQTTPLFLALGRGSPLVYWTSATGAKAGVWNVPR